ncbi:DUF5806 family protein [Methanocella arvoryzae]|uniref:Uncharacterized protein n=1 Tax=Methanocella arvoryzae (strain DSM 22066 / NBRC 105507 / MRE50) TaxID=351160 RepID=Q0W689_METAR|nr:DUF5806 family protein [Methanocella arvoryzae]CAJ36104.1 conserved hypothetical protein [Methanocella arvoryzae MRE50]
MPESSGPVTEKYWRFQKFDRKKYTEVNDTLKKLTHLTAREWAIARLCSDFKDRGRSQMTWIGENLPELVPFMNEKYARQDVASAEAAFKRKVVRSGTTFFYAYYAGLISLEEMLEMVQGIIRNIEELKRIEGSDPAADETSAEVQLLMAETLKRITDKLKEVQQ